MYLSVDAATKESLKEVEEDSTLLSYPAHLQIDRPLFSDFWERHEECVEILKTKEQRTVLRLTLVKSYNMEEVRNYAEFVVTSIISTSLPPHTQDSGRT